LEDVAVPSQLRFSLEMIDGDRVGKLVIPLPEIANWLNLLTSPHYEIQILYSEQMDEGVTIYFDACEAMYWYISDRVHPDTRNAMPALSLLAS
jgi:hypothetical protein